MNASIPEPRGGALEQTKERRQIASASNLDSNLSHDLAELGLPNSSDVKLRKPSVSEVFVSFNVELGGDQTETRKKRKLIDGSTLMRAPYGMGDSPSYLPPNSRPAANSR